MHPSLPALVGPLALFAALVGALALARFGRAMHKGARGSARPTGEPAFVATALEEAVTKLRDRERETKARAEASERLSGEIIASMAAGLLVTDQRGELQILNPAGRRVLALSADRGAGSFRSVLAGAAPLADLIEECLRTSRPIVRRTLVLRPSGEPGSGASHLGVTVSPVFSPEGDAHGAICLFTDLSTVAELEEQLRLRESLSALGELTAGLAHEFRNGLATIHGYGRLLGSARLAEPYQTYVAGIRRETESLSAVVTNFLDFARPDRLALGPVDLRRVAGRARDEIADDVRGHGGRVVVRGEFATIEGDEVLLRRAFGNLCRNAVEACVEAGAAPAILIEGAVESASGLASVCVADNGPGIPAAVADRLFRPFVTTKPQGTGLGLAVVQKIVVSHNGRVLAAAAPGGGTRMQVLLPLHTRA